MAQSDELPPTGDRIAKLLARAGVASRREIERMIAEGRIARDGVVLDTPATVLPSLAGVTVDGAAVAAPEAARLFLYHKPVGLLVTERDPGGRPTIYDRLPRDLPRLIPVGRLDRNTEGLLLLTTDGGLKRELELPATGVQRTYRARAYGQISQVQLETLVEGIEIDGMRYGSIDANLERRTGANVWIELTLTEGKNREVRRVLEYLGLEVSRLIRVRYGPFLLGDLPANGIGEVRQADLEAFRKALKIGPRRAEADQISVSAGQPRTAPKRAASPRDRLPHVGGGPVATNPRQRTTPAKPAKPQPDASLPRGGQMPARITPAANPSITGKGTPKTATPQASETTPSPRPAKLQRKVGWAKPKPKSGPARPRKPRT